MGVTAIAQSQSVTGRHREVIGVPLAYRNRHPGTASSAGHVESVGLVVDVVFRDVDEVDVDATGRHSHTLGVPGDVEYPRPDSISKQLRRRCSLGHLDVARLSGVVVAHRRGADIWPS
eukprot:TRINITY_DN11474_c1_g1_i1.p1 TRINITY_DN11474_c1_g1~~TRINITY_DN11474_c1_g1_i1.p1  ORF type:complete len:118 (+),score=3.38 TRINITY_DN11474_c1_g1_i1:96-449(+)